MSSLVLRNAVKQDADKIKNLIESNNYNSDDYGHTGLVDFPILPKKYYEVMIESSPFFYIFEHNSNIIAVFASFSKEVIDRLKFPEDEILNYFKNLEEENFIYCDFMVIDSNHRDQEFEGLRLSDYFFSLLFNKAYDMGYKTFYAAVSHKPENISSKKMLKRNNFVFIRELGFDGYTFGIYRKQIP